MKNWILSALFLSGCTVPMEGPNRTQDTALGYLRDLRLQAQEEFQTPCPGLLELRILEASPEPIVTLVGTHVPIGPLLKRVLKESSVNFSLGDMEPTGFVTVFLHEEPLSRVLAALLENTEYTLEHTEKDSSFWVLRFRSREIEAQASHEILETFQLWHRPLTTLKELFTSLQRIPSSELSLKIATATDSNHVILRGTRENVQAIKRTLKSMDQSAPPILVDVWVLAVTDELSEELSFSLANGRWKHWNHIRLPNSIELPIAPDSLNAGLLGASYLAPVVQPNAFEAFVKALVNRNKATFLSRIQLHALSGQTAKVSSGQSGYLLTTIYSGGVATAETVEVDATSSAVITPMLLPSGEIRMSIELSAYRFADNSFDLQGYTAGRKASTVVQIPEGQPMALVGVNIEASSLSTAGWPVGKTPFLSQLLRNSSQAGTQKQIVTIMIPYVDREGLFPMGNFKSDHEVLIDSLIPSLPSSEGLLP